MSVSSTDLVWKHSKSTGNARLVLLAIADHDGEGGAWPSVKTLAAMAQVSERSAQRGIEKLVALGELVVHLNAGGTHRTPNRYRPNRYEITVRPPVDKSDRGVTAVSPLPDRGVTPVTPRGDTSGHSGVTAVSPEPPYNHPGTARSADERASDPDQGDGDDGVAALRAAFAVYPALERVGFRLASTQRTRLVQLIDRHGVAALVAEVADTRSAPRSVVAFFDRWSGLTVEPRASPDDGPTCTTCTRPLDVCRAANARLAPEDRCDTRSSTT